MEIKKEAKTPILATSLPAMETIVFPNGNSAKILTIEPKTKGEGLLDKLEIAPPKVLITVSGGAAKLEQHLQARLRQLFSRGVARVAADLEAVVIDGGTQCGVMEMIGQGVVDRERKSPLIGIAPKAQVFYPNKPESENNPDTIALEANHSHFILVDAQDWGSEVEVMYNLAKDIVKDTTVSAVTILVNGGDLSRQEILRSVRLGWPIIIVEGSGRLADELANLYREQPEFIEDPILAEIIEEGDLHLFSINNSIQGLERLIYRKLRGDTSLKLAWEQFALYDTNAVRHQRQFQSMQLSILILGVVGTFLALLQTEFTTFLSVPENDKIVPIALPFFGYIDLKLSYFNEAFGKLIILIPVVVTILLTALNRFNPLTKWVMLRSSAESVKSEIFRYRAQASHYNTDYDNEGLSREERLAEKLKAINEGIINTQVTLSALQHYTGKIPPLYATAPNDDGFSTLSPEKYLYSRLQDQLMFYKSKMAKIEQKMQVAQWLIFIIGGVGTLLAAFSQELWIAFTTALVTALTTYIQYHRLEETLIKYNQATTHLTNLNSWWIALSAKEQAKQENIDVLVINTEGVLNREFSSWVEEMQEAMTALRKQQLPKALTNKHISALPESDSLNVKEKESKN